MPFLNPYRGKCVFILLVTLANAAGALLIPTITADKINIVVEGRHMDCSLTPGTFQAFFQYMNMSSEPITELSYMTNSLQSALASMERVYELLDEPEMEAEPEAPKRIGHALGAVEFSHVRFGQLLVNRHFVSFIHSFL